MGESPLPGSKQRGERRVEEVANLYAERGKVNPFSWLASEKYNDVWPNYDSEFQSMVTRTVTGSVTMEQFEDYVESLRNQPDLKAAFQEYAADYAERAPE